MLHLLCFQLMVYVLGSPYHILLNAEIFTCTFKQHTKKVVWGSISVCLCVKVIKIPQRFVIVMYVQSHKVFFIEMNCCRMFFMLFIICYSESLFLNLVPEKVPCIISEEICAQEVQYTPKNTHTHTHNSR